MSSLVKIRAASVLMVLLMAVFPGHAMASDFTRLIVLVFGAGFSLLGVLGIVISFFYQLPGLILNIILLLSYLVYLTQFIDVGIDDINFIILLPLLLNLVGFVVLAVVKLKSISKG